jgi:hypothetical protein
VLEPISTEGLTMEDVAALSDQVRGVIVAARYDLRAEFGD